MIFYLWARLYLGQKGAYLKGSFIAEICKINVFENYFFQFLKTRIFFIEFSKRNSTAHTYLKLEFFCFIVFWLARSIGLCIAYCVLFKLLK